MEPTEKIIAGTGITFAVAFLAGRVTDLAGGLTVHSLWAGMAVGGLLGVTGAAVTLRWAGGCWRWWR